MADPIRPKDLPAAPSVPADVALIIDNGSAVQKATPAQLADTSRPFASQAEAESGSDNAKTMTPLRVGQAIDARGFAGAIAGKEPVVTPGTTGQYYRGDKSWQTLDKSAVGLPNVDNTSDAAKPVSTAQQTALDAKAPINNPTFTGTVGGISKAMVGLGNVDNTADNVKPISTAAQTALNGKEPTITAGTTAQYYRGDKTFQTLDKTAVGLANVDNTSDANKPVSTAQQTALNLKVSTSTLALGTGAAGVGWTAPGTGGVLQNQDTKNRQIIDPRDYGAVMDGVTNDRAALLAADAVGSVRISKPIYVATSFTFTNPPEFVGAGKIVGPSSTVITLPGDVNAQRRLIFDGVSVAGLIEAWLEWFANDVKTTTSTIPTVDVTARLQRAMDAVAGGGTVFAGPGNWRHDGTTAVTMHQGQRFWGAGHGPNRGTVFYWPNTTRSLFVKTDLGASIRGGTIGNFRAQAVDGSATAASSYAIDLNQSDIMVRDVVVEGAYVALRFNVSYISRAFNVSFYESAYAGIVVNNSLDTFIDMWNVSGDDILVTSATPTGGAFVVGDAVTAGSSSGSITKVYSSTRYRVRWLGVPATSGSITATGKSATIAGTAIPHQGGMIRLTGTNESFIIGSGDGIGGEYGLVIAGTGSAGRVPGNSGHNVIESGAYFDSTYSGSLMDGAYGTEINGWFSTSRRQDARGLLLLNCRQITGSPRCENNAGSGLVWGADSARIYLAPRCVGNGRNYTLANTADVTVIGGAQYFGIDLVKGLIGFPDMNGNSAPKGLYIDTAGAGNFSVIGSGAANGSITNASTSDSQHWFAVPGVPWRVDKSALANASNDAGAAGAGVPLGGIYRNGSILMVRMV